MISIGDLAEKMIEISDLEADIHYTSETWTGDVSRLEADISKLKSLGYEPEVGLDEGLKKFKNWFEEVNGDIRN